MGARLEIVASIASLVLQGLVVGCGNKHDTPTGGVDAGPSGPPWSAPSCEAAYDVVGPACVPRFEECGDTESPRLGGGCLAVGVPKDGCAAGFSNDGKGACSPILPPAPCASGQMAVPGDTTCRDVAPCGTAPWGTIPVEPSTIYVDASYGGGGSDGSTDKPFVKIADAIAKLDGTTNPIVAIASGTYVEDVVLDKPVRLFGRCPSEVTIKGASSTGSGVDVQANGVEVHGVAITGPHRGVRLGPGTKVVLDQLWVHDTGDLGIGAREEPTGATEFTLKRSLVERATFEGIIAEGAIATIESCLVRDTAPARDGTSGAWDHCVRAADTENPATVTVSNSLVERTTEAGIVSASSKLTVEGTVVRDTKSRPKDGAYGMGVWGVPRGPTAAPATVTVRTSYFEHNAYIGIWIASSDGTIEQTTVRNTALDTGTGKLGHGIAASLAPQPKPVASKLVVRDCFVEGNVDAGISIADTTATVERTIVRGTRAVAGAKPEVATGFGIVIHPPTLTDVPAVALTDSVIVSNEHGGLLAFGGVAAVGSRFGSNGGQGVVVIGAPATLTSCVVRDGQADLVTKLNGEGVIALAADPTTPATLTMTSCVVERNFGLGILVGDSALVADRVAVRDTVPQLGDGTDGLGVVVYRNTPAATTVSLSMKSSLVERSVIAGVGLWAGDGVIERSVIRDTRKSAAGAFGDGLYLTAEASTIGPSTTASLTMTECWLANNLRAGVSVMGASLSLARSSSSCNAIDIDLEHTFYIAPDGTKQSRDYTLTDEGGNVCGCGDVTAPCHASSADLAPIGPPTAPATGR